MYFLVGLVPCAHVATYGQIAMLAGHPGAARAVGNLMRDSFAAGLDLPWHRIINAQGGVSFRGDLVRGQRQVALLKAEGIALSRTMKLDLSTYRWNPDQTFWEAS
ncbi:MAG: MGMT family protein [bacterium]